MGASFGGKFTSGEGSDQPPALASDGNQVAIAWKSDGDAGLSSAQIAFY
jgi:hypothetical protein